MSKLYCNFNDFVNWCNDNQGFLSFLLASIALITIIVTALLMRKSNRLSQENLSQAINLETQRSRPHLIVSIEHNDIRENTEKDSWQESSYYAHFNIKNIGLTPAYDVKITSIPELLGVRDKEETRVSGLLNNTISLIAPNQDISDCLCTSEEFHNLYDTAIFEFNLEYKDLFGNDCGHKLVLNLNYAGNVFSSSISSSKGESVEEKIHSALLNINMTLSSIASNSNISANLTNDQLSNNQEKLLTELISAYNKLPENETNLFLVSSYIQKDKCNQYQIYHNGFEGGKYNIEFDNLLSLERLGLIARTSSTFAHECSSYMFFITPSGLKY